MDDRVMEGIDTSSIATMLRPAQLVDLGLRNLE